MTRKPTGRFNPPPCFPTPPARLAACVVLVLLSVLRPLDAGDGVSIRRQDGKLRVEIGGNLFTEYHFRDTPRPFCHPVLGPGGVPMTRDWPMKESPGEEKDHPHHRSLWFAHGKVNGLDFWSDGKEAGKIVHQKFLAVKSGKTSGLIRAENLWVSAAGITVCSDERTLRFHAGDNPRIMDFEIILKACRGNVTFGDTKEGTLALRLAETLRLKPNSFNKDKPAGRIVLDTGIRDAAAWGQRAAWCDYSGQINGRPVGVAVFDHPGNPRHPTWWHVRDYGLFAANPFGAHDFEKKPEGTGDLVIPAGESIVFRHRFVFHDGDEQTAGIAALYGKYAAERVNP